MTDKILIYIILEISLPYTRGTNSLFESNNLADASQNLSCQTKSLPDDIHKSFLNSEVVVPTK